MRSGQLCFRSTPWDLAHSVRTLQCYPQWGFLTQSQFIFRFTETLKRGVGALKFCKLLWNIKFYFEPLWFCVCVQHSVHILIGSRNKTRSCLKQELKKIYYDNQMLQVEKLMVDDCTAGWIFESADCSRRFSRGWLFKRDDPEYKIERF